MNKKMLLIAPVILFGIHEPGQVGAQDNCETPQIPPVCQNARQISINANSLNVSPRNICGSPGQTIPVNVRPNGQTAEVISKSGDAWLSGSGSSFSITIPESASGPFEYAVYFPDGRCIDPRISVD